MRGSGRLFAVGCLVVMAACSKSASNDTVTPSPTPVVSATSSATDFEADASTVVEDLAAGRFAAVEAKFDVSMKAQLPPKQLENGWRTYQEAEGTYKSHGSPTQVMTGVIAVERVPILTATGTGEVRVSYHPDGTIAGLYFLKAGAPAPS